MSPRRKCIAPSTAVSVWSSWLRLPMPKTAMAELKAQGEAVYNIGVIRARQGDEAQTVVV